MEGYSNTYCTIMERYSFISCSGMNQCSHTPSVWTKPCYYDTLYKYGTLLLYSMYKDVMRLVYIMHHNGKCSCILHKYGTASLYIMIQGLNIRIHYIYGWNNVVKHYVRVCCDILTQYVHYVHSLSHIDVFSTFMFKTKLRSLIFHGRLTISLL